MRSSLRRPVGSVLDVNQRVTTIYLNLIIFRNGIKIDSIKAAIIINKKSPSNI